MRRILGLALALPLLATTACGDTVHIHDNIDLDWDFQLTRPAVDADLHTPYVLGSKVTISVSDSDDDVDVSGWRVVSENPAVFAIGGVSRDPEFLSIAGTSTGAGFTDLVVYDGDHERARTTIEVGAPDRVELDAHAWILIGREAEAPVDEARLVEGGQATYLVRYFAGARELHGNGALSLGFPQGIVGEARQSFLFEDREWLTLTADAAGTFPIDLGAGGQFVSTVPVNVVPATDVDRVEIHGEDESKAAKDEQLVAMAQAYDAQDRRIFGVEYAWSVDGAQAVGEGDLYRYAFQPGKTAMLVADDGTHAAAAPLHVGEGYVDSSNDVGCRIAAPGGRASGRPAAGGLAVVFAAGLAIHVTRRRRTRRAAS